MPPNHLPSSSRASAKPTTWPARATHLSQSTGAQPRRGVRDLIRCHGPTSCCSQPATRHPPFPEGEVTYVAGVAGPVTPNRTSGLLTLTAKGFDDSEPAVSSETASRTMASREMSGPLRDLPGSTTATAQVTNTNRCC